MNSALVISLPGLRSEHIHDAIQDLLARRDAAIATRYRELLTGAMNWEEAREQVAREFGVSDATVRRAVYGA